MTANQHDRIDALVEGEPAPAVRLSLSFMASDPDLVLDKVRNVMRQVAAAQSGTWPRDDQWQRQLPDWFTGSFEGHSLEERLANANLWDFGSWLDAIHHPGWEWWSSGASAGRGVVECSAHALPFSIEPLLYLLRTAGAADIDLG